MTNDTRAAFEAWFNTAGYTGDPFGEAYNVWIASRRAALEECAKLVETNHIVSGGNGPNFNFGWETALSACAKAIRALGDEGVKP